jgi:hypothetical protein
MGAPDAEGLVTTARRAQLLLAGVSVAVGLGGLIAALDLSFTENEGAILLGLGVSFNPLGALVLVALAALAGVGVLLGLRSVVLIAAAGFALGALQVVIQFGRDTNWLGTRGSNLSFFLACSIGLLSLEWLEQQDL